MTLLFTDRLRERSVRGWAVWKPKSTNVSIEGLATAVANNSNGNANYNSHEQPEKGAWRTWCRSTGAGTKSCVTNETVSNGSHFQLWNVKQRKAKRQRKLRNSGDLFVLYWRSCWYKSSGSAAVVTIIAIFGSDLPINRKWRLWRLVSCKRMDLLIIIYAVRCSSIEHYWSKSIQLYNVRLCWLLEERTFCYIIIFNLVFIIINIIIII